MVIDTFGKFTCFLHLLLSQVMHRFQFILSAVAECPHCPLERLVALLQRFLSSSFFFFAGTLAEINKISGIIIFLHIVICSGSKL